MLIDLITGTHDSAPQRLRKAPTISGEWSGRDLEQEYGGWTPATNVKTEKQPARGDHTTPPDFVHGQCTHPSSAKRLPYFFQACAFLAPKVQSAIWSLSLVDDVPRSGVVANINEIMTGKESLTKVKSSAPGDTWMSARKKGRPRKATGLAGVVFSTVSPVSLVE